MGCENARYTVSFESDPKMPNHRLETTFTIRPPIAEDNVLGLPDPFMNVGTAEMSRARVRIGESETVVVCLSEVFSEPGEKPESYAKRILDFLGDGEIIDLSEVITSSTNSANDSHPSVTTLGTSNSALDSLLCVCPPQPRSGSEIDVRINQAAVDIYRARTRAAASSTPTL